MLSTLNEQEISIQAYEIIHCRLIVRTAADLTGVNHNRAVRFFISYGVQLRLKKQERAAQFLGEIK